MIIFEKVEISKNPLSTGESFILKVTVREEMADWTNVKANVWNKLKNITWDKVKRKYFD